MVNLLLAKVNLTPLSITLFYYEDIEADQYHKISLNSSKCNQKPYTCEQLQFQQFFSNGIKLYWKKCNKKIYMVLHADNHDKNLCVHE
jgi:hypothetical protein